LRDRAINVPKSSVERARKRLTRRTESRMILCANDALYSKCVTAYARCQRARRSVG
jgi:hypothetical protein